MSQQFVAEFFTKINNDATWQQELGAALEGKQDITAATALAKIGRKHGYKFTIAEVAQNETPWR